MDTLLRKKEWLTPFLLLLFLQTTFLFPFAVERTYAGRNESPEHTLTYTAGNLVWDSATDVNERTGVAELSLFSGTYENVQSDNGEKVVAPGTSGKNIIRLKNNSGKEIEYIAVMYQIKESDDLPIEADLVEDDAFFDVESYPMPDGVTKEQVIKAVTGTIKADELQDFDIAWTWVYYENDKRDLLDTVLGDKAAWVSPDEVQVGFYIVVVKATDSSDINGTNSDDVYTVPQVPRTGDTGDYVLYLILMVVTTLFFKLLILDRRKEKQCRKKSNI